jgi:hypothetical protein
MASVSACMKKRGLLFVSANTCNTLAHFLRFGIASDEASEQRDGDISEERITILIRTTI